jgi:hypothetical protein
LRFTQTLGLKTPRQRIRSAVDDYLPATVVRAGTEVPLRSVMPESAQHAIKVRRETKEKIRVAALASGTSQADIVGVAINEFLGRHGDGMRLELEEAHRVLARGQ